MRKILLQQMQSCWRARTGSQIVTHFLRRSPRSCWSSVSLAILLGVSVLYIYSQMNDLYCARQLGRLVRTNNYTLPCTHDGRDPDWRGHGSSLSRLDRVFGRLLSVVLFFSCTSLHGNYHCCLVFITLTLSCTLPHIRSPPRSSGDRSLAPRKSVPISKSLPLLAQTIDLSYSHMDDQKHSAMHPSTARKARRHRVSLYNARRSRHSNHAVALPGVSLW